MQHMSRIPALRSTSFDDALCWFAELSASGLLFHPDDDPQDIVGIESGTPTFAENEVSELRIVMTELFDALGNDVYDASYPVFMKACGLQLDA